jgi:hypothetical protein
MRTLLISANTEQLHMPVLPMGLACVAAAARHAGHEVELLNLMTKGDLVEFKLENAVLSFKPELIGVSVRNIDDQCMNSPKFLLEAVKNIVRSCRCLTLAPIVLGGAGYSIFPRSVLAYLRADMGIRGEGEAAFVKLLDRLSRKESMAGIAKESTASRCLPPTAFFRYPPNSKIRKFGSLSRPVEAARWGAVTARLQP